MLRSPFLVDWFTSCLSDIFKFFFCADLTHHVVLIVVLILNRQDNYYKLITSSKFLVRVTYSQILILNL